MNWNEVRKIAKSMNINIHRMKKPDMIRAIQYAERNIPCFGTERVNNCHEAGCLWRADCMVAFPAMSGLPKLDTP